MIARVQATSSASSSRTSPLRRCHEDAIRSALPHFRRARQLAEQKLLRMKISNRTLRDLGKLQEQSRMLQAKLDAWNRELTSQGCPPDLEGVRIALSRDADVQAISKAADMAWADGDAPKAGRLEALSRIVDELLEIQESDNFQRELLLSQVRADTYTADNFAYGRTPFATWALVTACPPVAEALRLARTSDRTVLVAGSSIGWFCYYAALGEGVPAVGVEILEHLSHTAKSMQATAEVPGAGEIQFYCGDVLDTAPSIMHRAALVILASQCWDSTLHHKVIAKLREECSQFTVVVDFKRTCPLPHMDLVRGPVSWDPGTAIYVHRVSSGVEA